jgi:AcrR family transcriptional regulator
LESVGSAVGGAPDSARPAPSRTGKGSLAQPTSSTTSATACATATRDPRLTPTPPPTAPTGSYHHGDLRRALLDAAVRSISDSGPSAVSLRALAATAGVSHAAPVHHFGDKVGLFTAVAAEGFELLTDQLMAVWTETGDFLEVGVTYIRFALDHKGYFEVMFKPELTDMDDPVLLRAKLRSYAMLHDPLATLSPDRTPEGTHLVALASWSIVHGLATLALSGNLSEIDLADPDDLARHVLMYLQVF